MSNRGTTLRRSLAAALLAVALVLIAASPALATPPEGIMTLSQLQSRLEAAGGAPLHAYFKTVMSGSAVSVIPVDILGITDGVTPDSSLILIEANSPEITSIGGIAAGMSGSPIYLDGSIVGAISYGDYETLRGTGLATPIEYMTNLENATVSTSSLKDPVIVGGSVINRVIISNTPQKYRKEAASGAMIAKPLASIYLGGLPPSSRAYKVLSASLRNHGVSVVPTNRALSGYATVGGQVFSAPLVGGSAVASLLSRGDMWAGGIGTVTYTNGSKVVAFGHPAFGIDNATMTNAYIDGIWPSSMESYKMGRPGEVRGTFSEESAFGIGGVSGATPQEVPVTASAKDAKTGRTSTSASYMVPGLLDSWFDGGYYAAASASYAAYRANNWEAHAGSAVSTTTVKLHSGDTSYTVQIPNVYDDGYDIGWAACSEPAGILDKVNAVSQWGLEDPTIDSVSVETSISGERKDATIADVAIKGGKLRAGDNRIIISCLSQGVAETRTIEATLTLPPGLTLDGQLTAGTPGTGTGSGVTVIYGSDGSVTMIDSSGAVSNPGLSRRSLADVVAELNATLPNNTLRLSYSAMDPINGRSVEVTAAVSTDHVIAGSVTKAVSNLTAKAKTIGYNGMGVVSGTLQASSGGDVVYVYGTPAGETTETLLAKADLIWGNSYKAEIGHLKRNTKIRVVYRGSAAGTNAQATCTIKVRPRLRFSASDSSFAKGKSVRLSVTALPSRLAGKRVTFQRYDVKRHRWTSIGTRALRASSSGSVRGSMSYRPGKTVRVRASWGGDKFNTSGVSNSIRLHVK